MIPGLRLSEAEVVRIIYRMTVEEQLSCHAIAEYLNSQGIPAIHISDENEPPRGKRLTTTAHRWSPDQVRNMIVSSTYKGIHQYGRRSQKQREIFERERLSQDFQHILPKFGQLIEEENAAMR